MLLQPGDHSCPIFSPQTFCFNVGSPFQGVVMICCYQIALLMITVVGLALPLNTSFHMESFSTSQLQFCCFQSLVIFFSLLVLLTFCLSVP